MKEEMDRRWHDLGEFIREQRSVGQLSLRKLSEMAGVSNPYLSQIERGLRRPSAEILQQIARALEISSETLYVRAGILDEPGTECDPVSEIRRDPSITEEQKKTLVRIYESFRKENVADLVGMTDQGGSSAPSATPENGAGPASVDDLDRESSPG
ncbi:MAG: helix-turn-helix domain-containing protein [Acidimicrobiales bacterium]